MPVYCKTTSTQPHKISLTFDFGIASGRDQIPVDARSARTFARDFLDGISRLYQFGSNSQTPAALIYGGDQAYLRGGVKVYPLICSPND